MEHKISERVKIYHSSEYGKFKLINGNRELSETKIKKIIADINAGIDVLQYYPIQVFERDERLEVKDGQHRFYISKKLGRPVFYIVMKEDKTLLDVAKINSNVEKWKNKDFLNSHIQLGNKNYEILRDFMEKYGLNLTLSVRLLASGLPGGDKATHSTSEDFQRGQFEVKCFDEATALTESCQLFSDFRHWRTASFFVAVDKIIKHGVAKIGEIVINHKKYPDELKVQAGFKEYISNLQSVYNKKKHSFIIIYEDK